MKRGRRLGYGGGRKSLEKAREEKSGKKKKEKEKDLNNLNNII